MKGDKEIVLNAVKEHNKFSINNNLSEREMFFAKFTRDVDKIVMKMSLEDKARQLTQLHDKYFNPETKNEMTGVDSPLSVTQKDIYGIGSVLNVTKAEEVLVKVKAAGVCVEIMLCHMVLYIIPCVLEMFIEEVK